jgi:hypothetical protein
MSLGQPVIIVLRFIKLICFWNFSDFWNKRHASSWKRFESSVISSFEEERHGKWLLVDHNMEKEYVFILRLRV